MSRRFRGSFPWRGSRRCFRGSAHGRLGGNFSHGRLNAGRIFRRISREPGACRGRIFRAVCRSAGKGRGRICTGRRPGRACRAWSHCGRHRFEEFTAEPALDGLVPDEFGAEGTFLVALRDLARGESFGGAGRLDFFISAIMGAIFIKLGLSLSSRLKMGHLPSALGVKTN